MDWKIHRAILIAAIWIAEVLSAGICGFIAALALIPASYAARGYFAFGGEWLIVLGVSANCWRRKAHCRLPASQSATALLLHPRQRSTPSCMS